jgi:ribosomal protein L37E
MTIQEAARNFAIALSILVRTIGKEIAPDYWCCTNCGNTEYKEREVICWKCGLGEMIYKLDKVFYNVKN